MRSILSSLIIMVLVLVCAGILHVENGNFAFAQQPAQLPTQLTNEYRGTLSSFPHSFIDFKGDSYFGVAGRPGGFWKTDGSEEGTVMIKDIWLDYDGHWDHGYQLLASLNYIFFIAGQPTTDTFLSTHVDAPFGLWRSDGTPDGTIKLHEFVDDGYFFRPQMLIYQDALYFVEESAEHGYELWRSDGTVEGTAMFMDINPGSNGSNPRMLSIIDELLYFSASTEEARAIWLTDGTADGTKMVIPFDDSVRFDGGFSNLVKANQSLYFTTYSRTAG